MIYDNDAALREILNDSTLSERKKAVAREVLKRRQQNQREAWLSRHGYIAAVVGFFAGVVAIFTSNAPRRDL